MAHLFDDAGLFPPAKLPMAEALTAHERASSGPHSRVVGPFLCPATRLAELDVVVASVHSKLRMERREMTRRMVSAVASPHVDILGHCTGRKVVGRGRPPSVFDAEIVFAACAQFDTALEINCRPERQDPPDDLVELAMEWDLRFAIDTDAHAPGQMEWLAYGCDKAARHGIDPETVVNTMPADDLVAWAASHATG